MFANLMITKATEKIGNSFPTKIKETIPIKSMTLLKKKKKAGFKQTGLGLGMDAHGTQMYIYTTEPKIWNMWS